MDLGGSFRVISNLFRPDLSLSGAISGFYVIVLWSVHSLLTHSSSVPGAISWCEISSTWGTILLPLSKVELLLPKKGPKQLHPCPWSLFGSRGGAILGGKKLEIVPQAVLKWSHLVKGSLNSATLKNVEPFFENGSTPGAVFDLLVGHNSARGGAKMVPL